ncbi:MULTISPECIES: hypothetical protein [unclassified Mucilaginibacter]|uniref:hypothetical protein n=1 Tax=unclassified Mucilaginibacter TaxID=2617802 RepID=UPI002AC8B8D5|nr:MULTISPECIES: hypothetical protein [unclassified Mucilaginibacter]MEB0249127.1 hypothetical protein [Mucilaginibacter sp. 5B2]MEB0260275.1 hypothetical protein [Mucilaginibacter sp. 10I4]MEB0277314.1 hypothetical protein [Mucilaginibacter sp. 10B2]MEB0302165.1 hypothetical protein [Mucilaginibacter sp. 5C4]WPX25440.1 hypothetical protein RHM67_09200 [Mucilaginibacter sp. 5C4]
MSDGTAVRGTKAGDNDPEFVNFTLNNPIIDADFNTAWDFHLQGNSPALTKGTTTFIRNHKAGITTTNGKTYTSP